MYADFQNGKRSILPVPVQGLLSGLVADRSNRTERPGQDESQPGKPRNSTIPSYNHSDHSAWPAGMTFTELALSGTVQRKVFYQEDAFE